MIVEKFQTICNPASLKKDLFPCASVLFLAIYFFLTFTTGLLLIDWSSYLGVVFFVGFELMFIGLAYELSESLLSLVLKQEDLPKRKVIDKFPSVALLITICDDLIPRVLEDLKFQEYPNHKIFVLDDSVDPEMQKVINNISKVHNYSIVRRKSRRGYKAGNLNHWLKRYGSQFKYFIILDSDSRIPSDFTKNMVAYAEHPQNARIGIFQSKILPWNQENRFSRVRGLMAPLRMNTRYKVANRTGMVLSFGHNNLIKTDLVQSVGGFIEKITPEDTSLSLTLSAYGYEVKLVDLISYDSEPTNVFRFARRTIRWARQTVEVFQLPWRSVSFRLKLLICYHLYNYVIYQVYLWLLLLTAWTFKLENWSLSESVAYLVDNNFLYSPSFLVLSVLTVLWIAQIILRAYLAREVGIPLKSFFLNSILNVSLSYFLAFPIGIAMLQTIMGRKTHFQPTNMGKTQTPSLTSIVKFMFPTLIIGLLTILGIFNRNKLLLLSLNSLWVILILLSPVILWLFQKEQYKESNRSQL